MSLGHRILKLPRNNIGFIITAALSVFFSAFDSFAFLPEFVSYFSPNIALLVCFYWASNTNTPVSLLVPFGTGFFLDALFAYPFGLNSLILCLITYLGMKIPKRENKPVLKFQLAGLGMASIFAELLLYLSLIWAEDASLPSPLVLVYSVIGTLITWVVVIFLLDRWLVSEDTEVSF
ncbi:MAG: rod shape-determining protein MreD [Gammaproteobacteria bacterium]|nr:rod shape-determining protein MreD [Gammaproteobacteria bacterium]MYF37365.1 rod shape-determining protein MreD [Gammaproteobacteria bacterium]